MAKEPLGTVLHYIRQMASAPANQELTDKELLESFVACRDEGAFGALVQRHGALVWGVCRRVLRQDQDAEDAFQATFLVLARKAGRVRWQADVGNWLYAVAMRTAIKAKSGASRRCGREGPLQDMPATEMNAESAWLEIKPILDEELNRLPLKYRAPVVLHYFEGKTYAQAAQALGWPAGTVSTRLAQARHLLRGRQTNAAASRPGRGARLVTQHAVEQQADAYRDARVRDVEHRKPAQIEEIDDVAEADAVEDVADRTAQDHRKSQVRTPAAAFLPVPQKK